MTRHLTLLCALALAACGSTSGRGERPAKALTTEEEASEMAALATAGSPLLDQRLPSTDFVLFDQEGFPFPLAEQEGSWLVLHFFPESDTPDCACDATAFTGHLWRFNDMDAEVACVTSAPRDRTLRYAKKYGLQSPLLSDVDLAVASAYGAVSASGELVRTTFLLDPELRIAARWDDVKSNEHVEDILETLAVVRK
ncbi:Putative peroxiredoxin bcp [Planctomycetes bacterium Poly30]|uniref:thioredoxin-dependent peroxiredoxin n=1 Tax=Saltatorellus ferox TaxID=2528018 RepID=A0A518EQM2_9BACT|nr:Putative peroxiredoxin bcp [Planctomycetes bacterium Poly30]